MRPAMLVVACFCTLASAAAAQSPGTVQVGLFAQQTAFDEMTTLRYGTSSGLGASLGVYVLPGLVLEAGTSRTWTSPAEPPRVRASWVPLRVRAVYHAEVTENFRPLIGVGAVRNQYGDAVEGSDHGLTALAGFKTYVTDRLAFRSDLQMDWMGSPFNVGDTVGATPVSRHVNWTISAGMSADLGTGRFKDGDGDGVRDRTDVCPDTRPQVGVDTTGCRLDADLDRVFDEDDACPTTPPGVSVDAIGCRIDTDRDSVFDEGDACPTTPPGVSVDRDGCALDSDGDRVADHIDVCPGSPVGVRVDGVGCRVDEDADGVFDEDDRCPGTAPGFAVDPEGCQILFEEERAVLVLEGVTFETASAELTAEARTILDGIAAALISNADVRVRVNGHTDATGARAYNLTLSQARAESVVAYLTSRRVAADRLEAQGFGPDQPVADNGTADGRQENRRVELERIN